MRASLFLVISSLASLTPANPTFHSPINDLHLKRDFLSCQATYGSGSITCGDSTSRFCYDPTLGDVCCLLDDGYCKAGDFCAPVAGYCCHNGEDPQSCATRLDFTIPASIATAPSTSSLDATVPSTSAPDVSPTDTVPTNYPPINTATDDPFATGPFPVFFPSETAQELSAANPSTARATATAVLILTAPSTTPLLIAASSLISAESIPPLVITATVTTTGMHPDHTAPAGLPISNGNETNGTGVVFTGAGSGKNVWDEEVFSWGVLVLGVFALGMGYIA